MDIWFEILYYLFVFSCTRHLNLNIVIHIGNTHARLIYTFVMEYFSSSGETDNFSLQEMIESDMKTEFSEHLDVASGNGELDHIFPSLPDPILTVQMAGVDSEAGLAPASTSEESLAELGAAASGGECVKLSDLGWLQTVNLAAIKPENTDPNLLVNPQTGLPVSIAAQNTHRQPAVTFTTRQVTSVNPTKAQDAAVTTIQPLHSQIQIVNQPMSPMSPMHSPMSPLSPTMTQVTTQTQTFANSSNIRQPSLSMAMSNPPLQAIHNTQVNGGTIATTQQQPLTTQLLTTGAKKVLKNDQRPGTKVYPKPVYSYSCLIAMALKNSDTGALPVAEIYNFMT